MFRAIGPADNATFFDKTLKKNPIFTGFMFENCGIAPFTEHWTDSLIPSMMALGNIGRAKHLNLNRIEFDNIYVCVCAEMLGPVLPESTFLTQLQARNALVTSVEALFTSEDRDNYTSFTDADYNRLHEEYPIIPALNSTTPLTAEAAVLILRFLAEHSTMMYQIGTLGILVHTCISIIKRGSVTVQYIDKIRNGVITDLGSCPPLRSNVLSIFYTRFGLHITDTNIEDIFTRWTTQIGDKALRLTLSIQQSSGSGIISYLTIVEAIQKYKNFQWPKVYLRFTEEWNNFEKAVNVVGTNRYFGYRKDLGAAKSTNFKSLAYIAKELLIRIGGKASLRAYGGWVNRIPYKAEMDLLISEYEESLKDDITEEAVVDATTTIDALITSLQTMDM